MIQFLMICLLLFCNSLFGAQPEITADYMVEGNFHNVAIYLGSDEPEGIIVKGLGRSICQKDFPIIVSRSLFKSFLTSHANPKSDFSKVIFNDATWEIYAEISERAFLLIPAGYIRKREAALKFPPFDAIKTYTREEIISGFVINGQGVYRVENINAFSKTLINEPVMDFPTDMVDVFSLFVKGRDEIFGSWNIFLSGHGSWPKIELDKPLPAILKETEHFKALIAGAELPEFRRFIQFLISQVSVNFFYYVSCFAADVNLILPFITYVVSEDNIIRNVKKPNFVFGVGAVTAAASSLPASWRVDCHTPIPFDNVAQFFQKTEQNSNKKSNKSTIFKDNQLREILAPMHPTLEQSVDMGGEPLNPEKRLSIYLSSLPSVVFPGTDTPRVIALNEKTAVLNNSFVAKHELEKKPIILTDKEIILIYPDTIDVPLKLVSSNPEPHFFKEPAFMVSMLPGISLLQFKSIETNFSWDRFCFLFNAANYAFHKYFFIPHVKVKYKDSVFINSGLKPDNDGNISFYNVLVRCNLAKLDEEETGCVLCTGPNGKDIYFMPNLTVSFLPYALDAQFIQAVPNNTLANALNNYRRVLPEFDDTFGWKYLREILSPGTQALVEAVPAIVPPVHEIEPVPEPVPQPEMEQPTIQPRPKRRTKITSRKGTVSKKKVAVKRVPIKKVPSKTLTTKKVSAKAAKPAAKPKRVAKPKPAIKAKAARPGRKGKSAKAKPIKKPVAKKKVKTKK